MCRTLFLYNENVATALKKNRPTPFGMFLEADAKPARGCWHELLKKEVRYRFRTTLVVYSELFTTFALSLAETILHSRLLMVDGWDTYIGKAFIERFDFDILKSRKFLSVVKNKATMNVPWVCFIQPSVYLLVWYSHAVYHGVCR